MFLPHRITEADDTVKASISNLTQVLDELAGKRGPMSRNQILLKWLEAQDIIAITTSSKEFRLKENLETELFQNLSADDMKMIEQAVGDAYFRAFVRSSSVYPE